MEAHWKLDKYTWRQMNYSPRIGLNQGLWSKSKKTWGIFLLFLVTHNWYHRNKTVVVNLCAVTWCLLSASMNFRRDFIPWQKPLCKVALYLTTTSLTRFDLQILVWGGGDHAISQGKGRREQGQARPDHARSLKECKMSHEVNTWWGGRLAGWRFRAAYFWGNGLSFITFTDHLIRERFSLLLSVVDPVTADDKWCACARTQSPRSPGVAWQCLGFYCGMNNIERSNLVPLSKLFHLLSRLSEGLTSLWARGYWGSREL